MALLQPLDEKFAIVGQDGRPTLYFIKWAQQRQIDINNGLTLADLQQYLTDHKLIEGSGIQLSPSGDISAPVTISADVQEILDQLSATRGTIIYRGLLGWTVLLPGTSGFFLKTNGAGADPAWAAAGGGGGGSTPTIRAHNAGVYNAASVVVPFPAGTVVGDVVVVYWENGFIVSAAPAGWTPLWISNNGGTFVNQGCAAKVMTAADIATGTVTVTAGGAFNGFWGIVTLTTGTVASYDKMDHFDSPGGGNVASSAVIGMLSVLTNELVFGFASTRSNQVMTTSANLTVVRSAAGASASGIIYTVAPAALGVLGMNETIFAPVANNGLDWITTAWKGP